MLSIKYLLRVNAPVSVEAPDSVNYIKNKGYGPPVSSKSGKKSVSTFLSVILHVESERYPIYNNTSSRAAVLGPQLWREQ